MTPDPQPGGGRIRQRRIVLALLAVAAFAMSLVVQSQVVPLHSNNKDEGVYLFQARMLREGMVTLPVEEHGTFFRPWLSGEIDGRIFTQYQVGFPAYLAASDLVLGSPGVGLAAAAALTVVAGHGLALALLRDRRRALLSAALLTFTPLLVLHSALVLTYGVTVMLVSAAAWVLLRAVDLGSWGRAALAGALAGAAVTIRPLDALLFLAPFGLLALHRLRTERRPGRVELARSAVALVAGGLPFLVALLWYNTRTAGSPLEFPNMAADEMNRFGFGPRRLLPGEELVWYSRRQALNALWANVRAVPSWLFGGPVAVLAAVVGLARSGWGAERLALVGAALAFPAAYLFWWATLLSGDTATNGIGPHYYVPSFVALTVLVAHGAVTLIERWPAAPAGRRPPATVVAAVLAVVALAATAWAVPDKLAVQRQDTADHRRVADLEPDDLGRAVVVVDYSPRERILSEYPFHRPDPTLEADVLYAAERGALTVLLAEQHPDRPLYRLREELLLGDRLFEPTGTFRRLTPTSGTGLEVTLTPQLLPPGRVARAYLVVDGRPRYVDLGVTGRAGTAAPVSWTLSAEPARADDGAVVVGETGPVLVGVEYDQEVPDRPRERAEIELGVLVRGGSLHTLVPGMGRRYLQFPDGLSPVRHDVDPFIAVTVTTAPGD